MVERDHEGICSAWQVLVPTNVGWAEIGKAVVAACKEAAKWTE